MASKCVTVKACGVLIHATPQPTEDRAQNSWPLWTVRPHTEVVLRKRDGRIVRRFESGQLPK